jgi:GDP-mannose 6-dehydrogenase
MRQPVVGVEVSREKVALVMDGRSSVVEERIGDLIAEQVAASRLTATTASAGAVAGTDIALVCVGTPSTAGACRPASSSRSARRSAGRWPATC